MGVVTVRGGTGGSRVGVASAEGGGACVGSALPEVSRDTDRTH